MPFASITMTSSSERQEIFASDEGGWGDFGILSCPKIADDAVEVPEPCQSPADGISSGGEGSHIHLCPGKDFLRSSSLTILVCTPIRQYRDSEREGIPALVLVP